MSQSSLASVLMQITDGHPASAAHAARQPAEIDRYSSAERVVLVALLRHAREKSLKARVLVDPAGTGSNYPVTAGETTGN
jgi:hypothetical protein